ncbi:MAG: hypothetical protein M1522_03655 [Actinobacteria bacterium]|nr:hypothetical protein [Actinomycetota bacterium]
MTTNKVIVQLPDPIEELSGERSRSGRSMAKGWLKSLTGVDQSQSNGYAFLGEFLRGTQAELPIGGWVMGYGHDRRGRATVAVWQVTPDGLVESQRWDELGSPWALGCRDEIAALIGVAAERGPAARGLAEITLDIPDDAWAAAGDEDEPGGERAVLAAVVRIGGTHHHAVAYRVVPGSHDPQRVYQRDEDVDHYYAACGASGPFETTSIGGAEHLVFVTPFD